MTPSAELMDEALYQLARLIARCEAAAGVVAAIGHHDMSEKLRRDAEVARQWIRDIHEARP
jgi:lactam utilization protein B